MRPWWFLAACGCVVPALASADPFAEFRIPAHSTRSGRAEFAASGSWSDLGTFESDADRAYLAARLTGNTSFGWDSDALQYAVSLSLFTDARRQDHDERLGIPPTAMRTESRGEEFGQGLTLQGSTRVYPWQAPLGLEGRLLAQAQFLERWDRRESRSTTALPTPLRSELLQSSEARSRYRVVEARTTAGWGRVRDASVVYDVHVLEARLRATGALTGPLADTTREQLAALLYIEPQYGAAHERPERWFWRDVETILRQDGALAGDHLDAYSLLRLTETYGPFEPASSSFVTRRRGWFAGPALQVRHQYVVQEYEARLESRTFTADSLTSSFDSRTDDRNVFHADQVQMGGLAEYHRPFGWRWQVDWRTEILASVSPDERGLMALSSAGATWIVADRWRADLGLQHLRQYLEPRHSEFVTQDQWRVDAAAGLAYYLEDRTEIFAQLAQVQQGSENLGAGRRYERDTSVQLGLAYRFLGRLDAPGLIEPQRLMH